METLKIFLLMIPAIVLLVAVGVITIRGFYKIIKKTFNIEFGSGADFCATFVTLLVLLPVFIVLLIILIEELPKNLSTVLN